MTYCHNPITFDRSIDRFEPMLDQILNKYHVCRVEYLIALIILKVSSNKNGNNSYEILRQSIRQTIEF